MGYRHHREDFAEISSGHEFILVAIDYFTKWVEAASYARLTSSGVASFIRSHIICRYGVPHELISDRGVHFRAEVDTLVQRYSIRHHRSSAYRPQTNGAVEAANKNIKRILRRMVETSRDWSEKLPFALWAYRTSFRTSTALEQQIPEADWAQARFDQLNLLDERRLRAADHVRAYQRKMARAFKKRVKPRPLHVGDLVLKVIRGLIRDPRGKFRPNWSGPYFIRELTPEGAAWLMDLDGNRFSEPTNVDQLKRSDSVVFGLPGSFMDPHGLARSSLTGCSSRRRHDRYLTESLRSTQPGPHFSTLGFHHASPSGRSPLVYMIIHGYGIRARSMFNFILSGYSEEPLLTRSARFILFDIVVIPGWGYVECLDPHVIISVRGASSETRRVPFNHFQQIEICSDMPRWGIPPSLSSSDHLQIPSLLDLLLDLHRASPYCHCLYGIPLPSVRSGHLPLFQIHHHRSLTFRVIIITSLSFGIQSHHRFSDRHSESHPRFRRSESLSLLSLTFRVIIITSLSFGIQSHHRFSDRRSESRSRFRRSESLSLLSFNVQSHHHYFSQFRRSEPSSVFRSTFRVAFSVSAFRVVITSQLQCSEPSSLLLSISAFRAIIDFQIDIQSRILGFGVQSRYQLLSLTFRVIIITSLSFGIQSHHRFSDRRSESRSRFRRSESLSLLSFGVQSHHHYFSQFRRSEPSSVFRSTFRVAFSVSVFRVVITSQFDVQSHHHHFSQFRRSEPSSVFRSTFRVPSSVSAFRVVITSQFDVQSHHHHFLVSAFRAIIGFQIDIQSRILGFGVQSRYHFSV
ncbi:Gag-Pol polyprotein [Vitis vinifera]|uniref:Gag-Pol polyprotein n=1 Tax=Vitis vinifera TaxID=29760 RepID=A0A438F099_VITVI|nr:Gag-Pol polyprotein [Vitis vinifera]